MVYSYLDNSYLDKILAAGGVDPNSPSAPGIIDEEAKGGASADQDSSNSDSGSEEKSLPKIDFDSIPELDVDSVMSHEATNKATGRTKKQNQKIAARLAKQNEMSKGDPKPNIKRQAKPPKMADPQMADATTPKSTESDAPSKNLSMDNATLARFRRHIQRARRSLFRRDKGVTFDEIFVAEEILNDVGSTLASDYAPEYEPIVKLVASTKEVANLIDGFWQQVISSCGEITGGQEIQVGEQIVGFIEGDAEKLIVRKSGSNITYKYHFCPPGLAVAMAKEGTIKDVPTWEKQLAAFYAVNQLMGSNYLAQVDKHLAVADDAGHDVELIRHYANFDFAKLGRPKTKIEMPSKNTLKELTAEFREEYGYERVRALKPKDAVTNANLLFRVQSPNFEQHFALLDEARQLAIRGGNAFMVEDAVIEMGIYADIEKPMILCESFSELAKSKKLDQRQYRSLMEVAIPFLRSEEAKSIKPKVFQALFKRLMQIAKEYEMRDSALRLQQLATERE